MNNGSYGRVQLVFEFHSPREFTGLTLHLARAPTDTTFNNKSSTAGLTACLVNFAIDSGNYLGKSVRCLGIQQEQPDQAIYNVSVDLKHRVGRFLQIQLEFNSQWLLISEVTFQSGSCAGFLSLIAVADLIWQLELSDGNVTEDYTSDAFGDETAVAENPSEEEGPEIPIVDDGEIVDDSFEEISTGKMCSIG